MNMSQFSCTYVYTLHYIYIQARLSYFDTFAHLKMSNNRSNSTHYLFNLSVLVSIYFIIATMVGRHGMKRKKNGISSQTFEGTSVFFLENHNNIYVRVYMVIIMTSFHFLLLI